MKPLSYYHGAKYAMAERTATTTLKIEGSLPENLLQHLKSLDTFADINPGQTMRGVDPQCWWESFLVNPPEDVNISHLVAALAVAIQTWSYEPVARAQVIPASGNSIILALPWARQHNAAKALHFAVRFALTPLAPANDKSKELISSFKAWLSHARQGGVAPPVLLFAQAAFARDWPVSTFESIVQIGWGANAIKMAAGASDQSTTLASQLSRDRLATSALLHSQLLPVASCARITTLAGARKLADKLGWPVAIIASGPLQKEVAITNIADEAALQLAVEKLQQQSWTSVFIERHIEAVIYLLLVVNGTMLAASEVLPDGSTRDVTDLVHADNRLAAERSANLVGQKIAQITLKSSDISRSWRTNAGVIRELRDLPDFHPHWFADTTRDTAGVILDGLFKDRTPFIPTAAISGTNGKTSTAMMLHHIWQTAGKTAGVNTTVGTWIGKAMVDNTNLSGNGGARLQFTDPSVEASVIEMPRKGLMTLGHPCAKYTVAALLNVQDDHIGVDGINSLDEMAALKGQILERARDAIVINAEDPRCLGAGARASASRRILFSQNAENPALQEHLLNGGDGVLVADVDGQGWITLAQGSTTHPLLRVIDIPATMGGSIRHNIENAMAAAAMAWALGIDQEFIKAALQTFSNSPQMNPGRYNLIDGYPFRLVLDYGHNPGSIEETVNAIQTLEHSGRRILISTRIGNRHREHFATLAPTLARSFDLFVLGCEPRLVLKNPEFKDQEDPVKSALDYFQEQLLNRGVAAAQIVQEREPETAIQKALELAQPGDLVLVLDRPEIALPLFERHLT